MSLKLRRAGIPFKEQRGRLHEVADREDSDLEPRATRDMPMRVQEVA